MAEMSRYLIIIEEAATGYSAYSPDLPGCVAAGNARDRVEREIHDAIEFHLDGLRRAGEPIPAPRSQPSYCGRLISICSHGSSLICGLPAKPPGVILSRNETSAGS